jgi:hypothetical protein
MAPSFLLLGRTCDFLGEAVAPPDNESFLVNITIAKPEIGPFWVPELAFPAAAFCFKFLKTRDLPLLANKMHKA